jgi:hypothetical protein
MNPGIRSKQPTYPLPHFFRVYERDDVLKVQVFSPSGFDPEVVNAKALPVGLATRAVLSPLLTFERAEDLQIGTLVRDEQIGAEGVDLFWYARGTVVYRHNVDLGAGERKGLQLIAFPISFDGQPRAPYNRALATMQARDTNHSDLRRASHNSYITIHPGREEPRPLSECLIHLSYHPGAGYWADRPYTQHCSPAKFHKWIIGFIPSLKITSAPRLVRAGEVAELEVTVVDRGRGTLMKQAATVYLETTAGYLPRTRVIANPTATFKVRALDLEAGDEIKVKVGFSNYPGADEAIIKVV